MTDERTPLWSNKRISGRTLEIYRTSNLNYAESSYDMAKEMRDDYEAALAAVKQEVEELRAGRKGSQK